MATLWRISTINGFLLALYFVPAWTIAAGRIVIFPVRGLYDRANIAPALFFSDTFHLFAAGTVRFAWLFAIAKLLVAGFFALFVMLVVRASWRKQGDGGEALVVALSLAGVISFASMLLANHVGEIAALRLHATETLMVIGGLLLLSMDARKEPASFPDSFGITAAARGAV